MATKKRDDSALTVATTAAIASILGNIIQATENSKQRQVGHALRADRTALLHILGRFRKSHHMLEGKLANAQRALEDAQREIAERMAQVRAREVENQKLRQQIAEQQALKRDYDRLASELANKEAEISRLQNRVTTAGSDARA